MRKGTAIQFAFISLCMGSVIRGGIYQGEATMLAYGVAAVWVSMVVVVAFGPPKRVRAERGP